MCQQEVKEKEDDWIEGT